MHAVGGVDDGAVCDAPVRRPARNHSRVRCGEERRRWIFCVKKEWLEYVRNVSVDGHLCYRERKRI